MTTAPPDPERAGWLWLLAITLSYGVFAVIITWPAAAEFDRVIIGASRDGPMFLWNIWWAPQALVRGENPFWTNHLFHPEGVSRVIDTHCVLPALLSAPLQKWLGLIPAYNLLILSTFVLSGIGAALLAFELSRDRSAAFVSGTLFAFGHIRLSMVMFFNLTQSHLMVLTIWAMWHAVRRRSKGSAVLAGVFAASLLYSSYILLVLTLLFLALFAIALLVRTGLRHEPLIPRLAPFALAAVVALAISAPLLLPLTKAVVEEKVDFVKLESSQYYDEAAPLQRYFWRGPLHGKVDGVSWPIRQASYLGAVGLALGLLGIVYGARRPAAWFLLATSLGFFLLSLGPRLNIRGHFLDPTSALPLLLPFHYVSRWPLLEYIREAHRYALVGWLAWTALAGLGLAGVLGHCRNRWPQASYAPQAVAVLLALASVLDFAQWPFPMLHRLQPVPAELQEVAEDPRECAVLEYPAGRLGDPGFSWYQTRHGKPVYLDGELARIPPALRKRKTDSPLMHEFRRAFNAKAIPDAEIPALRQVLGQEVRTNRICWVMLSWADSHTLFKRKKVPDARIETLDRFVREILPVEKVVYFRGLEALEEWRALDPRERRFDSSLFAIYRLDFESSETPGEEGLF